MTARTGRNPARARVQKVERVDVAPLSPVEVTIDASVAGGKVIALEMSREELADLVERARHVLGDQRLEEAQREAEDAKQHGVTLAAQLLEVAAEREAFRQERDDARRALAAEQDRLRAVRLAAGAADVPLTAARRWPRINQRLDQHFAEIDRLRLAHGVSYYHHDVAVHGEPTVTSAPPKAANELSMPLAKLWPAALEVAGRLQRFGRDIEHGLFADPADRHAAEAMARAADGLDRFVKSAFDGTSFASDVGVGFDDLTACLEIGLRRRRRRHLPGEPPMTARAGKTVRRRTAPSTAKVDAKVAESYVPWSDDMYGEDDRPAFSSAIARARGQLQSESAAKAESFALIEHFLSIAENPLDGRARRRALALLERPILGEDLDDDLCGYVREVGDMLESIDDGGVHPDSEKRAAEIAEYHRVRTPAELAERRAFDALIAARCVASTLASRMARDSRPTTWSPEQKQRILQVVCIEIGVDIPPTQPPTAMPEIALSVDDEQAINDAIGSINPDWLGYHGNSAQPLMEELDRSLAAAAVNLQGLRALLRRPLDAPGLADLAILPHLVHVDIHPPRLEMMVAIAKAALAKVAT